MPNGIGGVDGGNLLQRLGHVVFAEVPLPSGERLAHHRCRVTFADGDKVNGLRVAAAGLRGACDLLAHAGDGDCDIGHIMPQGPQLYFLPSYG